MPISVNLAVTSWFPLEFNICIWKQFSLAIIFIVAVFIENHAGNNTLILNQQVQELQYKHPVHDYRQVWKQQPGQVLYPVQVTVFWTHVFI